MAGKINKPSENKIMAYALIVLVLVLVLFWAVKKNAMNNYVPQVTQNVQQNTYPAITDSNDLDKAAKDIDVQNVDVIDKELNGLSTDSSNF